MDQGTFEALFGDFQQQMRAEAALPDLTVAVGRFDAPIVALIHGIGGNAQHWADPVELDPATTWLFDLASPPRPPTNRVASPPGHKRWGRRGSAP